MSKEVRRSSLSLMELTPLPAQPFRTIRRERSSVVSASPKKNPDLHNHDQFVIGMALCLGETIVFGGAYLLGSQAHRGVTFERMAPGFGAFMAGAGVLGTVTTLDLNEKQYWTVVAVTVAVVAAGLLTGALAGF